MKLLQVDYDYYKFPDGIENIEEFVEFVNSGGQQFIKMTKLCDDHCVPPYFIEEDQKTVYVNFLQYNTIEEVSGKVMLRIEYERKLRDIVQQKCLDCANFEGDPDDLSGHYSKLCLDGTCWAYKKCGEDEE